MLLKSLDEIQEYIEQNGIRFFNIYNDNFQCRCGCGEVLLDSELLEKLDYLRSLIDEPIKITSAYRCKEHNARIGGKPSSSHLKGLAVDIFIPNNHYRYKVLDNVFVEELFNRIGVAENFIHLDIDENKPQEVCWGYFN